MNNADRLILHMFYFVLQFFWGSSSSLCQQASPAALETAKFHVNKYYSFISITEDIGNFWWGLEQLFPRYFKGLTTHLTKQNFTSRTSLMTGRKKPDLSRNTTEKLSSLLAYDIQLYKFIKQIYYNTMFKLKAGELWNDEGNQSGELSPGKGSDKHPISIAKITPVLTGSGLVDGNNHAKAKLGTFFNVTQDDSDNIKVNRQLLLQDLGYSQWDFQNRSAVLTENRKRLLEEVYGKGLQYLIVDELVNLQIMLTCVWSGNSITL